MGRNSLKADDTLRAMFESQMHFNMTRHKQLRETHFTTLSCITDF